MRALDAGSLALVDQLRSEVEFLRRLTEHQAATILEMSRQPAALVTSRTTATDATAAPETAVTPSTTDEVSTKPTAVDSMLKEAGLKKRKRRRLVERLGGLFGR